MLKDEKEGFLSSVHGGLFVANFLFDAHLHYLDVLRLVSTLEKDGLPMLLCVLWEGNNSCEAQLK